MNDSLTTVVRILAYELSTINVVVISVGPAALRSCIYALDQCREDRRFAMDLEAVALRYFFGISSPYQIDRQIWCIATSLVS